MSISSHTPEGRPNCCPICRKSLRLEPSPPAGDAPCPNCGHLLWWFKDHFAETHGASRDLISPETSFVEDLGADSVDTVELVMELEEEFDITIPDVDAERIATVADAIRYIERHGVGKSQ